jgi:hypothetical protein
MRLCDLADDAFCGPEFVCEIEAAISRDQPQYGRHFVSMRSPHLQKRSCQKVLAIDGTLDGAHFAWRRAISDIRHDCVLSLIAALEAL